MKVVLDIPDQRVLDTLLGARISYWAKEVTRDGMSLYLIERDTDKRYAITDWRPALMLMAMRWPQHFADLVGRRGDMVTGDVLVQLACFEDLKYG